MTEPENCGCGKTKKRALGIEHVPLRAKEDLGSQCRVRGLLEMPPILFSCSKVLRGPPKQNLESICRQVPGSSSIHNIQSIINKFLSLFLHDNQNMLRPLPTARTTASSTYQIWRTIGEKLETRENKVNNAHSFA